MADGSRKRKLDSVEANSTEAIDSILTEIADSLKELKNPALSHSKFGCCLLKFSKGDAASIRSCFSSCNFTVEKNNEVEYNEEPLVKGILFSMISIFGVGMSFLEKLVSKSIQLSDCRKEFQLAFVKLKTALKNKRGIFDSLTSPCKKESETSWTVKLAHHLLKNLAVYNNYKIDRNCSSNGSYDKWVKCPCCCAVDKDGHFGDCSMGHEEVLHGSVDILLGKSPCKVVVEVSFEAESEDQCYQSAFEVGEENSDAKGRRQAIVETVVFGFLQKKKNPELERCLIPTISISAKKVKIFFYDPDHDILLESSALDLFVYSPRGLDSTVILILWLAINYTLFSSGVTEGMIERKFTSDFLKNTTDDVQKIYRHELQFGNVKGKEEDANFIFDSKLNAPCDKESSVIKTDLDSFLISCSSTASSSSS